MTARPTPCAEGRGVRHLECREYDACLRRMGLPIALDRYAAGWTCGECPEAVGATLWVVEQGIDWPAARRARAGAKDERELVSGLFAGLVPVEDPPEGPPLAPDAPDDPIIVAMRRALRGEARPSPSNLTPPALSPPGGPGPEPGPVPRPGLVPRAGGVSPSTLPAPALAAVGQVEAPAGADPAPFHASAAPGFARCAEGPPGGEHREAGVALGRAQRSAGSRVPADGPRLRAVRSSRRDITAPSAGGGQGEARTAAPPPGITHEEAGGAPCPEPAAVAPVPAGGHAPAPIHDRVPASPACSRAGCDRAARAGDLCGPHGRGHLVSEARARARRAARGLVECPWIAPEPEMRLDELPPVTLSEPSPPAGVAPASLPPADCPAGVAAPGGERAQIAAILRELRKRSGLSQAELARRSGTTPAIIATAEAGRTVPWDDNLVALFQALDAPVEVAAHVGALVATYRAGVRERQTAGWGRAAAARRWALCATEGCDGEGRGDLGMCRRCAGRAGAALSRFVGRGE